MFCPYINPTEIIHGNGLTGWGCTPNTSTGGEMMSRKEQYSLKPVGLIYMSMAKCRMMREGSDRRGGQDNGRGQI